MAVVFAAGIGMGYVAFQQSTHVSPMMMNQQQMQYMMNDPEAMEQWMESPQHIGQMTDLMKNNHDFMQEMMMEMINDPNLKLQMLGHMSENHEAMEQMREMVSGNMLGNMTMMNDDIMHP